MCSADSADVTWHAGRGCAHLVQCRIRARDTQALLCAVRCHSPDPQVAAGRMLGPDQPVILHLLDIEPAKQALDGVRMELLDAAFPLLQGVHS